MPTGLRRTLVVLTTLVTLAWGSSAALAAPGVGFTPDVSGGLAFGNVEVGGLPQSQTVTVENTGDAPLDVTSASIAGGDTTQFGVGDGCSFGAPLDPGGTCELLISFTPTSPGAKTATVEVVSDGTGSPHTFGLSGTGTQPAVQLSGSSLAFGTRSVDDGPTAAQTVTIANGGTAPLQVLGVQISGGGAIHFPISAETCTSGNVAPGDECTVDVTFDPQQRGALAASLDVISNAPGSPHSVSLAGTGQGPEVTPSPTSIAFGDALVADPATAPELITITNDGDGPLNVTATDIIGTGFQSFAVDSNTCTGVAPAATCQIGVVFDPPSAGAKAATLSITSNAGPNPTDIPLTGTGLQPAFDIDTATVDFGTREVDAVGASAPQTLTVTNTGSSTLAIGSLALAGGDPGDFVTSADTCSSANLSPAATCTVDIAFDPAAPGAKSASLTFPTNAPGTPHAVVLSGTGTQPALNARATLPFGAQPTDLGPTPSQRILVENTGSAQLDIGTVALGGTDAAFFAVAANDCDGAGLAPSATCAIDVTFDPDAQVSYAATVSIPSDAPGSPHVVALSGAGAPPTAAPVVTLDPGLAMALGDQPIADGPTAPQVLTIGNTGTANLDLGTTTLGGSDPGEFSLVANGCVNEIVGPGEDCTVGVRFDPSATGAKSANLTVASNDGPIVVSLTGTGTEPLFSRAPSGTLDFGQLAVLAPLPVVQRITVTSDGTADLNVLSAVVQDDPGFAFGVDSQTCLSAGPLNPTSTCTIDIAFDPGTPGLHQANLVVTTNAPDSPHTIPLEGTGTQPAVSLDVPSLAFADRDAAAGPSAAEQVVLTNTGDAALNVATVALGGDDPGQFAIDAETCTSGAVVAAGTCTVDVTFDPTGAGAKTATLVVTSDAPSTPDTVALTGTGVAAPTNDSGPTTAGVRHRDGVVLSADPGAWSGTAGITYAYQWQRCDVDGGSCAPIPGAGAADYTPGAGDVGATLRVEVTATNAVGSLAATSGQTPVVGPRNTTEPTLQGEAAVGAELRVGDGEWNGAAGLTLTRRWERCPADGELGGCVPIADASDAAYRTTQDDAGSRIRAIVGASASGSEVTEAASPLSETVSAADGGVGAPGPGPAPAPAPGPAPAPAAPAAPAGGGPTPGPSASVPGAPSGPGRGVTTTRLLSAKVAVTARKKPLRARSRSARTRLMKRSRPATLRVRLSSAGTFTAKVTRRVRPSAKAKKRARVALKRCALKKSKTAERRCKVAARKRLKTRWVKVGRVRSARATPAAKVALGKLRPGRYRVAVTTAGTTRTRAFTVRPQRVKLVAKKRSTKTAARSRRAA